MLAGERTMLAALRIAASEVVLGMCEASSINTTWLNLVYWWVIRRGFSGVCLCETSCQAWLVVERVLLVTYL